MIIRPDDETLGEPFWRGLAEGRLTALRCSACGAWRHPPAPICHACASFESEWAPLSGRARLYSYTVARHPVHATLQAQVPYVIALVELAEGIRMVSSVRGVEPAGLRIGMGLRCVIEPVSPDFALPYFHPAPDDA
jgi:uncharacterized OB-fold protein